MLYKRELRGYTTNATWSNFWRGILCLLIIPARTALPNSFECGIEPPSAATPHLPCNLLCTIYIGSGGVWAYPNITLTILLPTQLTEWGVSQWGGDAVAQILAQPLIWYWLVRFPNLYFGSRLGVQYPKNSKIFLWLLPQPSSGNALV